MSTPANKLPRIGITMDVVETPEGRIKVDCGLAYAMCVERAGGVPVFLPPISGQLGQHLQLCDGFILTGGDDPRMESFGVPTHPQARIIHPRRQEYELGLLEALRRERPDAPVLGICLGMQLMALDAGGRLNQYLPDSLATHAIHKNAEHRVIPSGNDSLIRAGMVWSNHRQAVEEPGRLRVVATSEDGVIEAVRDHRRRWYVGVQWHPERTSDTGVAGELFQNMLRLCRA